MLLEPLSAVWENSCSLWAFRCHLHMLAVEILQSLSELVSWLERVQVCLFDCLLGGVPHFQGAGSSMLLLAAF